MSHAKYPSYPAYKPSGVEWLGEVPEGWIITEAKYYFEIVLGKMLQNEPKNDEDLEVPYLKALHVQWNKVILDDLPTMWASQLEIVTLTIQKGDLLVCEGGEVGRASIVEDIPPHNCIVQNALHLVKPKQNSNVKYLKYILSHISITNWFDVLCNRATIAHFTSEKFKELIIPLPPLDEQRAIATFLDRETARIDTLIAKMQRLLDLLAEKRQALITHAVTKGLDPHAPMKDSGVEWLGEVPQGWEVKQLKQIAEILRGKFTFRPRNDPSLYGGEYPFIQTGDVSSANKYITGYSQTLNEKGLSVSKQFPTGTLVMTIAANIGDLAILTFQACFPDSIVGFVPYNNYYTEYLYYSIQSIRHEIYKAATTNTQMNINVSQIGSILTVVPHPDEQRAIADYLDKQTACVDRLCQRVEEAIARLQERRVALITAAVTGQIDIRSEVHAG